MIVLAQAILNQSGTVSQAITNAWDQLWQQTLVGPLYTILNNVGITLAIISLLAWLYSFYRNLQDRGIAGDWAEIIWPLLIILLLANGGSNLRNLTFAMRTGINTINNDVLNAASSSIRMEQVLSELANYSSAQSQISELRKQCDAIVSNAELTSCLNQQREKADDLLQEMRSQNMAAAWIQSLQDIVLNSFNIPGTPGSFRSMTGPALLITETFMIAMQGAFQAAIEVSMLLTALMGPIAVGVSLLPIGAKPVYAWLTAFSSLGVCKLSLNIITGFVATAIHNAGPFDTLSTAIVLGLLSPILALGLSAGGGMAIFNGITSTVSSAARVLMLPAQAGLFR